MDMIEKVARALDPEAWENDPDADYPLAHRRIADRRAGSLENARAAIKAMREPTKRMRMAACAAMSPGKRPTQKVVSNPAKHAIRYRAMIDAALSPAPSNTPTVDHANHTGSAE